MRDVRGHETPDVKESKNRDRASPVGGSMRSALPTLRGRCQRPVKDGLPRTPVVSPAYASNRGRDRCPMYGGDSIAMERAPWREILPEPPYQDPRHTGPGTGVSIRA